MENNKNLTDMTVDIVAAYVAHNSVPAIELPGLIGNVHKALTGLASPESAKAAEPTQPAVSVKKSISNDFIVCLEDGRKFKSLKRHLRTKYSLTPDDYRAKWGLPKDYPMVAPAYAKARSDLAKSMGLGQGGRAAAKTRSPASAGGRRASTA